MPYSLLNCLLFSYFDICICQYFITNIKVTNMKEIQQGNLLGGTPSLLRWIIFGHFLINCSLISTSKFSLTKTAPSSSSSYSAYDAEPGRANLVTNSYRRRCRAKVCPIYFCPNPTKLKRTTSPETLHFDVKTFSLELYCAIFVCCPKSKC